MQRKHAIIGSTIWDCSGGYGTLAAFTTEYSQGVNITVLGGQYRRFFQESEQREKKQGSGGELADALEEILFGAERDLAADARMAETGVRRKKKGMKGEWRA